MKIKASARGLTFSFRENECFKVGTRYRYIYDVKNNEILIIPDENGKYKMSRKGTDEKPLVDLRNSEIKNLIEKANYLEIEFLEDKIAIHIIKLDLTLPMSKDRGFLVAAERHRLTSSFLIGRTPS